jgi:tRNA pseudouridine38-40 synthase
MRKIAAVVEYDGARFHGWQLQKDLPTVQGAFELALERIFRRQTRVHAAGRTDAGVHAKGQVAHFTVEWTHSLDALQRACNALLPDDVTVRRLLDADEDFHARHSARSKTYAYRILNQPLRSALARRYSWHAAQALDISLMQEAAGLLVGSHDFAAFGSPTDGTPSTVRRIFSAQWSTGESNDVLVFKISGTGFLRYMVRSVVGTLVLVGRGKITPPQFSKILESRDRGMAGPTAPPHGLCLESVEYQRPDGRAWTSDQMEDSLV